MILTHGLKAGLEHAVI